MNKISINRKEIQKYIITNREKGKTDQEIYNELTLRYYDKKSIALLITGSVTRELKDKYLALNSILLILLSLTLIRTLIV